MPGQAVSTALAAAQSGDIRRAVRLLEQAAAKGDGYAVLTLANWRVAGQPIARDLPLARELYGRAAELGVAEAETAYTSLLANGAGGSGRRWQEALKRLGRRAGRDPRARDQLKLIEAMSIDVEGDPLGEPVPRTLNPAPRLQAFDGFVAPAECRFLVDLAQPLLKPATVVQAATGALMLHPVRKADFVAFPFINEPPLLHAINRRIAAATGTTYEQGEPAQVMSYTVGQEFRLHTDFLVNDPNQRKGTFLICLDDRFAGGQTVFPRLDISWRGNIGDALYFEYLDDLGQPDARSCHAGAPVTEGRKYILSKWIRSSPLDLRGPPVRPL